MAKKTYKIVRMYQRDEHGSEVILTGLTLKEAQKHCRHKETSSRTCRGQRATERTENCGPWFDAYTED